MRSRNVTRTKFPRGLSPAITLILALLLGLPATWGVAQNTAAKKTSLQFLPQDAAFYGAMLNNRRQLDAFLGSKAFAKLAKMQAVQLAVSQVQAWWNNDDDDDLTPLKQLLADPQNRDLIEVLGDAISQEVFFYGGNDYVALYQTAKRWNDIAAQARIEAVRAGEDADAAANKALLAELGKSDRLFKFPATLIGFKMRKKDLLQAQIRRLESQLQSLIKENPRWQGRLKRVALGASSFLVLEVDGSMIPWDQLDTENSEIPQAAMRAVIEKLKKTKVAAALGIHGDYLLLSIGEDLTHIAQLGRGPLLRDRPEFAGLSKAGDHPLTSVSYVSESLMKSVSYRPEQVDEVVALIDGVLPVAELPLGMREEIRQDAKALGEDLKPFIPRPGAYASFSFMNEFGYEGYIHSWTENVWRDGSKPLSILQHVGEAPLLLVASRRRQDHNVYALAKKWLGRGVYYFEHFGLSQLEAEDQNQYNKVREEVEPYLKEFDRVTTELFFPSLRDGQQALVIDAVDAKPRWFDAQPASDHPLPLPSPALVTGVSDAAQLKLACAEYFRLVQRVMDRLHAEFPEQIPRAKLPPPKSRVFADGEVFYYGLPAELGADAWLAPNAGLSREFLVLSMMPRQTVRLLARKPLGVGGPLTDIQRPLASAMHVDFAGVLRAAKPWLDYAFQLAQLAEETTGLDDATRRLIQSQTMEAMELLQCLRSFTSASSTENGAVVTHYQWRIDDLR